MIVAKDPHQDWSLLNAVCWTEKTDNSCLSSSDHFEKNALREIYMYSFKGRWQCDNPLGSDGCEVSTYTWN